MGKATILIVEDEAIVAADLAGKLNRLGYIISGTTGFGEEAVNQAREERPDLVLMDIRLKGTMDGIEAAGIIRREFDLPVIFLTAHSDRATLDRAKLAEPFGYILKPFEERELTTNIEMALYKHQTERRLRQAHDELELRVAERTRELKEAEQGLREMNETLEQRVAERTAELQAANTKLLDSRRAALNMMEDAVTARRQMDEKNEALNREIAERKRVEEALRIAKEAAEAATRTKSQFLANMSHELRTPMTGVLGMLDLVLAGDLAAEQRKFIAMAQTSARSLIRILNDILDLTRIEMGKLSLEEKPFLLRKCLADTYNLFLPAARNKGLDLRLTVADDVPETLVGDQTRLSQILTNLAGNAVKFTEKGQVEIRVTTGGNSDNGKQNITFTVTDSGIGIPDDKQDLLFRVFSQVDESHSREYGGTGLGLAISKEIVEHMGGTITFTSKARKGSTFSWTIPLAATAAEQGASVAAAKTATAEVAPSAMETKRPHLLVAEDDPIIRQILEVLLQQSNYEIDFVENGEKAIEKWENGAYDLILMDVQMPRLNGFEATAAIRAQERSRGGHIPIIAMTAHALKEDKDRCVEAGMDAYISKPVDFNVCLQLIEEILKKQA